MEGPIPPPAARLRHTFYRHFRCGYLKAMGAPECAHQAIVVARGFTYPPILMGTIKNGVQHGT